MTSVGPVAAVGVAPVRNWMVLVIRQGLMVIVTVGGLYGLAKLQRPADFALYGYVNTALLAAAAAGDIGLGARLIRTNADPDEIGPSFAMQLGVLLPLTAVGWALCAIFLHSGDRLAGAAVVATGLLVSLAALPTALLERRGAFSKIGVIEVSQRVVLMGVGLALAASTGAAWSVPIAGVCAGAVGYGLALRASGWRYRPRFGPGLVRSLRGFASDWWLARVCTQLTYAAYPLLGGLLLSGKDVGLLVWALGISSIPTLLAPLAARAIFPALTRSPPDQQVVLYRQLFRLLALLAFPLIGALLTCARPLTENIFGTRWEDGIGLLQMQCGTAVLGTVLTPVLPLLFLVLESHQVRRRMVGFTCVIWLSTPPLVWIFGRAGIPIAQLVGGLLLIVELDRCLRRERGYSLIVDIVPGCAALALVAIPGLVLARHIGGLVETLGFGGSVVLIQVLLTVLLSGRDNPLHALRALRSSDG